MTTSTPKIPSSASTSRVTLGDLEKRVTVGEIADRLKEFGKEVLDMQLECEAHWSDDSGLHYAPYLKDLGERLDDLVQGALARISEEAADA